MHPSLLHSFVRASNFFYKSKEQPKDPKSIIIVHPQGIGDLVVATPCIQAIYAKYPNAEITLVSTPSATLLRYEKSLKRLIIVQPHDKESVNKVIEQVNALNPDIVIDLETTYTSMSRLLLSANMKGFKVGLKRGGFEGLRVDLFIPYQIKHMTDIYLDVAQALGAKKVEQSPTLFSAKEHERVKQLLEEKNVPTLNYVVMHATTQNPLHAWSKEKWAKVADEVTKSAGTRIIFTGATNEVDEVNAILTLMKGKAVNLAGVLNLNEFAALLSSARLVVSIDTSTVHIASALNTKLVALYGPTVTAFWGPSGKRAIGLSTKCEKSCQSVDLNAIHASKESCDLNKPCLRELSTESVILAAQRLLAGKP